MQSSLHFTKNARYYARAYDFTFRVCYDHGVWKVSAGLCQAVETAAEASLTHSPTIWYHECLQLCCGSNKCIKIEHTDVLSGISAAARKES